MQITDIEAQKQKTGKTAEETLQSLNRDTQCEPKAGEAGFTGCAGASRNGTGDAGCN